MEMNFLPYHHEPTEDAAINRVLRKIEICNRIVSCAGSMIVGGLLITAASLRGESLFGLELNSSLQNLPTIGGAAVGVGMLLLNIGMNVGPRKAIRQIEQAILDGAFGVVQPDPRLAEWQLHDENGHAVTLPYGALTAPMMAHWVRLSKYVRCRQLCGRAP